MIQSDTASLKSYTALIPTRCHQFQMNCVYWQWFLQRPSLCVVYINIYLTKCSALTYHCLCVFLFVCVCVCCYVWVFSSHSRHDPISCYQLTCLSVEWPKLVQLCLLLPRMNPQSSSTLCWFCCTHVKCFEPTSFFWGGHMNSPPSVCHSGPWSPLHICPLSQNTRDKKGRRGRIKSSIK